MRASGDPYLQHCVETAALLAELGAGPAVVAAGLLHDTVDDAGLGYGSLSVQFGAGVADLVKGVIISMIRSLDDSISLATTNCYLDDMSICTRKFFAGSYFLLQNLLNVPN